MSLSVKGFKLSNGNVVRYDYSSLDNIITDSTLSVSGTAADAGAVGLELSDLKNEVTDIDDNITLINTALADKVDGAYADNDGYLYLTSNGEVVVGPIGPFAGGGGGTGPSGGNNATITVANTTGWLSTTISESEQCNISFNWSSVEDDFPTGDGSVAIRVNGVVKEQKTIQQGDVTINVRGYLASGSNIVRLTVSDVYGNSRTISFTISLVALSISASAFEQSNASATYSNAVLFTYIPVGAVTKNVTFKLDNNVIGTQEVTTSGRQQTFTIPAQTHGSHGLEVYFTAEVNGVTVESNHLYFSLIFVESGNNTPIIASPFNATGATQYYTLSVPYTVYTPNSATSDVSFTATVVDSDNHTTTYDLGTRTVNRTQQTFTYTPNDVGTLTLTITTGSVSKSFVLTVAELNIDVEAETDSLQLYLSARGRSNSEAYPGSWSYNNISCTFNNFNFLSDGWTLDDDNSTCLKVTGDARLTIPFKIFEEDFRVSGKTIEFDFSTSDVKSYDTPIVSCISGGKGLVITPQSVTLTGSDNTVASTQYKEDEHVRIAFVIEKVSEHRLVYTYINGICSGIIQYPASADFQQELPVNITIGSNEATINLYTIRIYNNSLPRHQVLNNWIADTPDGATMLERYNHNNVYDEYGDVVINKLPSNLPYLIVESATLPAYKGDKKTISGSYTNPMNESLSFEFTNASMDVQGTSSAGYPRKNYKIKFKNFTDNGGNTTSTYCLRGSGNSIPSKVFCFKADYASSEGANNVELVRLYNDSCPYETPPQQDDEMVRQGIDGIPILIFWSNTNSGTTTFLGKYNFNFDKSSPVFGFEDGDESWETTDNSNQWALFKNADYSGNGWLSAFEARFPDLDDPYTDSTNLAAMAQWVNSTDRDGTRYEIREIKDENIVHHGGGFYISSGYPVYKDNSDTDIYSKACVIKTPTYKWNLNDLKAHSSWDETNKYLTGNYVLYNITIGIQNPTIYESSNLNKPGDRTNNAFASGVNAKTGTTTTGAHGWIEYSANPIQATQSTTTWIARSASNSANDVIAATEDGIYFLATILEEEKDNIYLYWSKGNNYTPIMPIGVQVGDIIYAGKNTTYYGRKNVDDTAPVEFDNSITYEGTEYNFDSTQYRLAKFRNELTNWFDKDDVLFYYLFTELFLMIDSRVKNSFPTLYASHNGAKWCWLPYDMDTAIGINNEGKLAFDYDLEDIDAPSKLPTIYNGRETVMWNNVRDAFPSELRSMYQSLRAEGLISYEEVENRFETHQHTWPEAIFNEDAYFKYVKPFIDDGEDNLAMCLGSKEQQRKWWLYNRFRYIDSKYNSGNALSSYIQARVYHKSDLDVTPYADIYASAYFDSNLVQARAERNTVTTVESPEAWDPGGADAVLRIYSADQIKSLGDMSQFYVGDISFAAATKLQEVKLGDADVNYSNEHLVNVGFGNNTLLSSIDIRNCPNLTQVVDVSGCTGLETVHLEGTNVAGIHLADASAITELYLPASITNLTLKNQSKLETLEVADMSNIETLWVEGTMASDAIDWIDDIAGSNRKLRIVGFNKTFENDNNFYTLWDKISASMGLDDIGLNTQYAYLNGEITINVYKRGVKKEIEEHYPFLTVNYTSLLPYNYQLHLTSDSRLSKYEDNVITSIGHRAFFYNNVIRTVTCPNVTSIGEYSFSKMNTGNITFNLPNLDIAQAKAFDCTSSYSTRTFNFGKLREIRAVAFGYCYASNLDFLNSVEVIAPAAFDHAQFNEIRLPNLKTILNASGNEQILFFQAMYTSLIDIPDGVTNNITDNNKKWAFYYCQKLTALILRNTTMLVFANADVIFSGTPIRQQGSYSSVGQGYIYVPRNLVDTYKADWATKTNLADLAQYIRAIEDYPEICDPNYEGGE